MPVEEQKRKILVVDDEPDVIFVLRTVLEKNGFAVEEANNGLVALDKTKEVRPDLIITDLMMPQMDGFSVNLKLKENPETADIPVVVMTGKGHLKELLTVRSDLNVAAYLEKPFRVASIVDKIKEILKMT